MAGRPPGPRHLEALVSACAELERSCEPAMTPAAKSTEGAGLDFATGASISVISANHEGDTRTI